MTLSKHKNLFLLFAMTSLVGLGACNRNKAKDLGEDVGDRIEDVGDKTEDVIDDAVN